MKLKTPYPFNTKAFWIGVGFGIILAGMPQMYGCSSAPGGAKQIPARRVVYMKGADGRTIAVAPGPEVVE